MSITIRDIRVVFTEPDDIRLAVVKVETSEPGLYGLGCATFTQRPTAVAAAVDDYLRPFLLGRDVADIEQVLVGEPDDGLVDKRGVGGDGASGGSDLLQLLLRDLHDSILPKRPLIRRPGCLGQTRGFA